MRAHRVRTKSARSPGSLTKVCPLLAAALAAGTACAGRPAPELAPPQRAVVAAPAAAQAAAAALPAPQCRGCTTAPVPPELAAAIEVRVAQLKAQGGECAAYAVVLEDALASGHITIRPYMWRVRGNLASAEGESSGEMTIARDIDSLNIGVRALDDVLRSAEHEAAHIALKIASGDPVREGRVDDQVNACRGEARR